jgi:hypothetical protein
MGQTPASGYGCPACSAACFVLPAAPVRLFCAVFPAEFALSRRRIRQSRRKNAGFAALVEPSGHTSPVVVILRLDKTAV